MKHKLESRLPGEISITLDMQMTPPKCQKAKRKYSIDDGERGEKAGLKLNIQKMKIMPSSPVTSWQIDGETVTDFIFLDSKITVDDVCGHEIKRILVLEEKLWQT